MNEEKWKTIYDVQVYVTFVLILWKNTAPYFLSSSCEKMNLGFIMVGLVFLISIPSNSSTTIKNKENPWSYCYSDDLRFLQSKKEGRGISVFLYTRCTEQKYKLLINYSDYEESTFCLSQISQRRKL